MPVKTLHRRPINNQYAPPAKKRGARWLATRDLSIAPPGISPSAMTIHPRFIPLPPPSRPGPRPLVERLASLKHPIPIPIQRPQLQPKSTTHPKTATCPNPSCPAPNIVEDDGQKVCSGCGTVVSDANIVSEITFG